MTKPEKDEVLQSPDNDNTGGGASSPFSSSESAANKASRSAGAPHGAPADGNADAASKAEEGKPSDPEVIEAEATPSTDEQVAAALAEAEGWKDKYLRLHAEWDTYRRRTAEQREDEKACATEKLVERLLPVLDDFERCIEYAEKNGEAGLTSGVQAVQVKLLDVLDKEGVTMLDPKGEAFDALEAQAVSTVEDAAVPDETVAEVFQKGYKMGRKVLRPAMVTVATGGPKREVPQESEQ